MKRKLVSCLLAWTLLISVLPMQAAAVGAEVNTARIIAALEEYWIGKEGDYGSVNRNDNGAVSLGKLQWHAARALDLVKKIVNKNRSQAQTYLGTTLYNEVVNASLSAWASRTVSYSEADKLSKLLVTVEGRRTQDEQAAQDIGGYLENGYSLGIRSDNALMYYCDIENQYGSGGAKSVVDKAYDALGKSRKNGDQIASLQEFHAALLRSTSSLVQTYIGRRISAYNHINRIVWSDYDALLCKNCPSDSYWDVPNAANWAHEGIDFVLSNGLFTGCSEYRFLPDGSMTRAMLVTVLYRLDGGQSVTAQTAFTDVPDGKWYTQAVNWAADKNIVTGERPDSFNPNGVVSREQIAVILYRYTQYRGIATQADLPLAVYPDASRVSEYALSAISWATAAKLINGDVINGQTCLNPDGDATRAQVAVILMRYCSAFY